MKTRLVRHVGLPTFLCALGLIAATPSTSLAQILMCLREPCAPCPTVPSTPATGPSGTAEAGAQSGQAAESASTTTPDNLLAYSGAGAASGPQSMAPTMVGDYLGGFVTMAPNGSVPAQQIPLPGGAIPRFKMAENTSPLPMDRFYFNYDSYSNVPLTTQPTSVNAFTPGFEKTLFGGVMSVEVRLPMATTLNNTIFLDGTTGTGEGQVGNLGITVKALILQSDTFAVSAGLGINCPTARDSLCFASQDSFSNGIEMLNQSVHLLPFVGGLWTPNERLFCLGYMQFDVDANGDQVNNIVSGETSGPAIFSSAGRYYEQTMIYLDGLAGYWIRRDDDPNRWLNGIAVFGELHGNQSLNTSAPLNTAVGTMAGNNISILDMTFGVDLQFGRLTTITTAYSTPLTAQREFDGQFRLMFNRRF